MSSKYWGPKDVTSKNTTSRLSIWMASKTEGQMRRHRRARIYSEHQTGGDGIAGIIAISEEVAERAAQLVKVEYMNRCRVPLYTRGIGPPDAVQFTPENRQPGFQVPEAMFPGNALGWGDVDKAFEEADLVIEDTFYTPGNRNSARWS